jgi:ApaG protein
MSKGKKRGVAYEAETDGIVVRVKPSFLEDESSPEEHRFIWAYHVEIENRGSRTFQLMTRHWRITDREGRVQEVNGSGVVGKNPVLAPGETFEYTSGCPLSEPSGVMQGTYRLEDEEGGTLEARIPLFTLDSPYDNRAAN